MSSASHKAPRPHGWKTAIVSWSVGPLFLLLAAWLLWFAPDSRPSIPATPPIDVARLAPVPRAPVVRDPASARIGGFEQRCNACHRLFDSVAGREGPLYQHTHITFDHGLNNRCSNCHDLDNREALALRDGATLPFARSPELCAQCHGTTYRDWQVGMHGKTLGTWRTGEAGMRRLLCVECHDPHAPAYAPVEPMPAPHTLRTPASSGDGHAASESPLALPGAGHGAPGSHDESSHETHEPEGGHEP